MEYDGQANYIRVSDHNQGNQNHSLENQVAPTGETPATERTGGDEGQRACHDARLRRNLRKFMARLDMTEHEEEDETDDNQENPGGTG